MNDDVVCLSQEGELSDGESVNEYAVNAAVSDATGTGTENGLGEDWWEGHVVPPCPVESIVGRLRSQLIAWREDGCVSMGDQDLGGRL